MKLDGRMRNVLRALARGPSALPLSSTIVVDKLLARRLVASSVANGETVYALTARGRAEWNVIVARETAGR